MARAYVGLLIACAGFDIAYGEAWGKDLQVFSDGAGTCYVKGQRFYMSGSVFMNVGYSQIPASMAANCQQQCKANPRCSRWSFSQDGDSASSVAAGACFLYDNTAAHDNNAKYVSGLKECPPSLTSSDYTLEAPEATQVGGALIATVVPVVSLAPVATVVPVVTLAPIVPTVVPVAGQPVTTTAEEITGGSGGFPAWGIGLIVLGVALAGLAGYFMFCGNDEAPKKKKKTKRAVKGTSNSEAVEPVSASIQESAPLMQPVQRQAPAAAGVPQGSFVAAPMGGIQMAPQASYGQASYAAPQAMPQQMPFAQYR